MSIITVDRLYEVINLGVQSLVLDQTGNLHMVSTESSAGPDWQSAHGKFWDPLSRAVYNNTQDSPHPWASI